MTEPKDNIIRLVRDAETLSDGKGAAPAGTSTPKEEKAKTDDGDINLACAFLPRTDLGNSERFMKREGEKFLYVEQWGWLAWDGKRWNIHDADAILARAVHQTIKDIRLEAKAWKESEFDFIVETKKGVDIWDSMKLMGWCLGSQGASHIACVSRIAQSHLTAAPDSFDRDPMAMNVDNGTLHFAKSDVNDYVTFTPHARQDRMTKITPVAYDPKALCPQYDEFLRKVQPDDQMQVHLHAWGGVSLTALALAQLAFWHGTGRNGKSTLIDTWAYVMGDYAQTIPIESFLDQGRTKRGGDASPDIAALPGVRCLRTSEPDKGAKLDESLLKLVTGGEPLRARHLNRDFFEFRPSFKMTMQGNYKPVIHGTDEGFWSRFLLVPWKVMIPKDERDPDLPMKLRAEAPGILNRLLDGLRYYMDKGLSPPDKVIEATAAFRDDTDPIGRFLADCVKIHAGESSHKAPGQPMFRLYAAWCKAMGERRWSPKNFSRSVQEHGIERVKSSHIFYIGIEMVKTEADFAGEAYEEERGDDRNRR